MTTAWLPKVRVAGMNCSLTRRLHSAYTFTACNVAPVFLDTAKTVQKTVSLIGEAARNKADLVVFPGRFRQ